MGRIYDERFPGLIADLTDVDLVSSLSEASFKCNLEQMQFAYCNCLQFSRTIVKHGDSKY